MRRSKARGQNTTGRMGESLVHASVWATSAHQGTVFPLGYAERNTSSAGSPKPIPRDARTMMSRECPETCRCRRWLNGGRAATRRHPSIRQSQKVSILPSLHPSVAVGVGFEPTEPLGSLVFKTRAFGHSATPPGAGCRRAAAPAHRCPDGAVARADEHSAETGRHEDFAHSGCAPAVVNPRSNVRWRPAGSSCIVTDGRSPVRAGPVPSSAVRCPVKSMLPSRPATRGTGSHH